MATKTAARNLSSADFKIELEEVLSRCFDGKDIVIPRIKDSLHDKEVKASSNEILKTLELILFNDEAKKTYNLMETESGIITFSKK